MHHENLAQESISEGALLDNWWDYIQVCAKTLIPLEHRVSQGVKWGKLACSIALTITIQRHKVKGVGPKEMLDLTPSLLRQHTIHVRNFPGRKIGWVFTTRNIIYVTNPYLRYHSSWHKWSLDESTVKGNTKWGGMTPCTEPQTAITPVVTHCIMQSEMKWKNLTLIGKLFMIIGGRIWMYFMYYACPLKFPLNGLKKRSTWTPPWWPQNKAISRAKRTACYEYYQPWSDQGRRNINDYPIHGGTPLAPEEARG